MIELIPAIDLIDGACVRLQQGDFSKKTVYDTHPTTVARHLERLGFRRLHLVDLDGAKMRRLCNIRVLQDIKKHTGLKVDFGGGICSEADIETIFSAGAEMVTIGSMAAENPELVADWIKRYGAEKFIIGADVYKGEIAIHGWYKTSNMPLTDFIDFYTTLGVRKILCTDIARDGMLNGPSTELYQSIMQRYPELHLIASGGVAGNEDIEMLDRKGIPAVVFGKALYEKRIQPERLFAHYGIAKRIIPCLDIKDGTTVKGVHFDNLKQAGDPIELAKTYCANGADELVLLDISASKEGRKTFTELVSQIAQNINIPFTVGGGISELSDVERLLQAGADKVSINSAALNRPQLIKEISNKFGSQVCTVAIDAKIENNTWYCYTKGGSERTDWELKKWACHVEQLGAGEILFTSMDHDGTKNGFANDILAQLADCLHIPIIASGGAGCKEDFLEVLTHGRADAALAASVFHYGEIGIPNLKKYLKEQGVNIRL